jgi:hypothetical protein
MAAKRGRFEEIYRQKTQGGESTFSALKSTAAERRKELTDLRRMFPTSGILGAMLESAFGKAYKYKGKGTPGVAGKDTSSIDNKTLNVIRLNTAITAKNSMVLPGMARDMNVMRQNIVKMAKQSTGSAATKADAFFLKSKERENAYESEIAGKSPSRADGKQSAKDKEKSGFFSGLLGSILSMSIKDILAGLLKGGLIGGLLVGIGKYFTDPEFRKSVNDMLNNLGEAVFGAEYWEKLKKDIQENLVDGALIVGGSYLAFKVASNLLSTAVTALATNISTTLASFLRHPAVLAFAAVGAAGAIAVKSQMKAEVGAAKKNLKYAEEGDLEKLKLGVAESFLDENYDKNLGYNPGTTKEDKNLDKMERAEVRKLLQKAVAGGSKKAQNALNRLDASYGVGPTMNKEQQEVQTKIDALIAERENLKKTKPADSESQKLRISEEISKLQKQKRELRGVSPTVESSVDSSSASPTQLTSDVKFSDLTPEQQLIVIREQRRQEGFYPGSASYDLNNPGNMVYSEQTAKFGAIKDPSGMRGTGDVKGKLAQFPSLEAGEQAQRDLLANGVNYRNLSLDEALKRWTGSQKNPQESANYRSNIFAKLQIDHTEAVNENTVAVNNLNKKMDEEKNATMTEMLAALIQGMSGSGTTVNNVNNTSVASAGSVASPYNEDMLALFKQRASVGL